jgi:hypothetical protein
MFLQRKGEKIENIRSELCHYGINLKLNVALHLVGIRGEHAAILTACLDLPAPHKWPHQFWILESYTHKAIDSIKLKSQQTATDLEILETLNEPSSHNEQHLLANDVLLYRVKASFDMGWQVHASGGKYASTTSHGLLIGVNMKKIIDSIVYNKKCATCAKHHAKHGSVNVRHRAK